MTATWNEPDRARLLTLTIWCVIVRRRAHPRRRLRARFVGATQSGDPLWTLSQVETAMHQAGLVGFKPIPDPGLSKGKQIAGVNAKTMQGGFYYVSPNLSDPFAYSVAVARDRSTIAKLEAGLIAKGGPFGPQKFLQKNNVLIAVLSSHHPTDADRAAAARLPLAFLHLHQ